MYKSLISLGLIFLLGCSNALLGAGNTPTIKTTNEPKTNNTATKADVKLYNEDNLQKVESESSATPTYTTNNGELQYLLKKNDQAPYDGLLFNNEAVVRIIADRQTLVLKSTLDLKKQREYDLNVLNYETKKISLELDKEKQTNQIIIDGQDKENKRLQKINEDLRNDKSGFWSDVLYVSAGGGVGILVGIVIGVVVANK